MSKLEYDVQKLPINLLFDWFRKEKLIIDNSYQRRSIWSPKDKVKLIETILLGLIIPEVYFWDAETNPEDGSTITHIVDGQQRITTIVDFIENKFKLSKDFFEVENTKGDFADNYSDKFFKDLDKPAKEKIWTFSIPIVQIKNISIDEIKTMFYRLNLTNYSLNDSEKRHSRYFGLFADLSNEIAELEFWVEFKLFNLSDFKRMKDVEFCSTLILLAIKGIINQTNQEPLNNAFEDYSEDYPNYEIDRTRIFKWIDMLKSLISTKNLSFLRKKTQLYTVFCLMDYLEQNEIQLDERLKSKFNDFVSKYDKFENSSVISTTSSITDKALNKYKLASSEGVNKIRNRKIRFEILRGYVLDTLKEQNLEV